MEPQLPQVNINPENTPISSVTPEQHIDAGSNSPEAPIKSPEAIVNTEKSSTDNFGQVVPPVISTSQTQDDSATKTNDDDANDVNPTTASDSDLIEKEWVKKAKAIVSGTVDDPYKQQDKVSKLMIDYVQKRYGRKIGESNG